MNNTSALLIAPHADDEILGCGGTLIKLLDQGFDVQAIIVGDGVTSRDYKPDPTKRADEILKRHEACRQAARLIGAREPIYLQLLNNRLDQFPLIELTKEFENVISSFDPSIVFIPHGGDTHPDHRRTHEAAVNAVRPLPGRRIQRVFVYETPSSTEWSSNSIDPLGFRPNHFVDIDAQIDRKVAALRCYVDELREFPHPRSVEAVELLAKLRGTTVGMKHAEAFMVLWSLA